MADKGELLPTDLIWQKGMSEWIAASSNQDLFLEPADEPPPLPSNQWNWERVKDTFGKLRKSPIKFWSIALGLALLCTFGLFVLLLLMSMIGLRGEVATGLMMFALWLDLLVAMPLLWQVTQGVLSKDFLCARWDLVDGSGPSIQFTRDGAMLRMDGVAARYRYLWLKRQIEIVQDSTTATLDVLSVSKHELVVSDGATSQHYKRGDNVQRNATLEGERPSSVTASHENVMKLQPSASCGGNDKSA